MAVQRKAKKIYVLDTSVLLHDHNCINNFEDNYVAIPITVLEELDKFKVGNEIKNFVASECIRIIDRLSENHSLQAWIPLGNGSGGKFKIVLNTSDNLPSNAEKIFDAKREEVQNLKAEFDLEDKLWLKAKQVMQLKFKAIEEKAEWKANFVKRFEAEQKELRTQKRIIEVSKYAEINRIEFENMSEDIFDSFLSGLKANYEAKIEAEKKAEAERIEAEMLEKASEKGSSIKRSAFAVEMSEAESYNRAS
jgi:PhoH-like ATPase